jgi:cytochrome c oxidase assembly protein subunit 15
VTWLWLVVLALWAMIVVGGVVRLTRSGLSITVWEPIVGTLPPLGEAAWERLFALYRRSPEFRHVNPDMDLAGFKSIFWPEYFHRLLARGIGVIIVAPCAFFWFKGWLTKKLVRRLILLLVLGGVQGLVGWLMVASGIIDVPHVSHYRLTAHLGMGVGIFAYAFWVALEATFGGYLVSGGWPSLRKLTLAASVLSAVTVLSGGLVAGLKAGHAFPTFPRIAGQLVPDGLLAASPAWRNFFDNALTVQFQHRVLGLSLLGLVIACFIHARRLGVPRHARIAFDLLLFAALGQVALGIATLLWRVPVTIAVAHQGNAALVFVATLCAGYALRRWPRNVTLPADIHVAEAPPAVLGQPES